MLMVDMFQTTFGSMNDQLQFRLPLKKRHSIVASHQKTIQEGPLVQVASNCNLNQKVHSSLWCWCAVRFSYHESYPMNPKLPGTKHHGHAVLAIALTLPRRGSKYAEIITVTSCSWSNYMVIGLAICSSFLQYYSSVLSETNVHHVVKIIASKCTKKSNKHV